MSRTDVHRPAWVKERDPRLRREFVEHHYHWVHEVWDPQLCRHLVRRSVPCDLDVFLASGGRVPTRCGVAYRGGRNIYCGCRRCTGQGGRKLARRQERAGWRSVSRQLLAAVDREDLDVPPVRATPW